MKKAYVQTVRASGGYKPRRKLTRFLFDSGPTALTEHCVLVQPIQRQVINLGLVDQRIRDSWLLRLIRSSQNAADIALAHFGTAERTARKRRRGAAVAFLLLNPRDHARCASRVVAR